MKYFSKSPNDKMIKLGDDPKTAKWYYTQEEMKEIIKDIKEGDEVTIKSQQISGAYHLTFLAKGKVDVPQETKTKQEPPKESPGFKKEKDSNFRTPEAITRAELIKATAETLIALQSHLTLDNVLATIDKVYNRYTEKMK